MQKKHIFILLIALTLILSPLSSLLSPIRAASPIPSPTSSASSTPSGSPASINEVTENLKKRLQSSLDEPVETPLTSAISYVGIVKDIIKDTVIIEDKDGKRDIKLKDDTTILRSPGNTSIKPENIRIDDYIIAIGYPGDNENLNGRRLIVSADAIKPPAKTSDMGTITKIGKASLTISLGGEDQILTTTTKTIFKSPTGTIEFSDLSVGDTLIFTATVDDEDDLTATLVMRILSSAIEQ